MFLETAELAVITSIKSDLNIKIATAKSVIVKYVPSIPSPGILVFLTGKREIMYMCRKINKALNKKKSVKTVEEGSAVEKIGGAEVEVEGGKKRARSFDAAPSSEAALSLRSGSSRVSSSTGSAARSGVTLRGMDDDEIEGEEADGAAIDGQDDDMFLGAGESDDDEDDYESEEDGEGYDSLGEDEIFLEEKAKRAAAASAEAAKAPKSGAELEEEMSAESLRNKMLREVLGLPERYGLLRCTVCASVYRMPPETCQSVLSSLSRF